MSGPASAWTDGYLQGVADANRARDITDARRGISRSALWVGLSAALALGGEFDQAGWVWVIAAAWLVMLAWYAHDYRTLTRHQPKE